ncbi:hypothetical protein X943_002182 [Babesia divergens]|uniref:Uncharacterized protein n=1 Tax=Babesia divergens TaxID=32595 RepID=A0AAD9GJX1_BABDI|nr:hypothetical protein X943_002182 [Babesia divergens]
MERTESEDSSSTLYKVMVNRRIVEKVQMNMNAHDSTTPGATDGAGTIHQHSLCCTHPDEIDKLTRENKILEQKYNETFEALDKVRQTALEASERALSREFRIVFLEKALHGCEVSLGEANDQLKERDKLLQQAKRDMEKELGVLRSQVDNLNLLVRGKDARILEITNEHTRALKQLEEIKQRKSELLKQLKDMCEKLNTVVWETNQREKMLNNLENELKKREMERQSAFLNEVTRSKRLLVSIKVKENVLNKVITTKNQRIHDLELQVRQLLEKINRISGVFYDINQSMEPTMKSPPFECTTSADEYKHVECNVNAPCNMQLLSGRAKLLI